MDLNMKLAANYKTKCTDDVTLWGVAFKYDNKLKKHVATVVNANGLSMIKSGRCTELQDTAKPQKPQK